MKRKKTPHKSYKLTMPDGSVLTSLLAVDKYRNLNLGTTCQRIHHGWTEECAQNFRNIKPKHIFNMPDGQVFTRPVDVDKYYKLGSSTTNGRIGCGWTDDECARNFREIKQRFEITMPDGSVLHNLRDIDRYNGLKLGITQSRFNRGWTIEECINNCKEKGEPKYKFKMPDGSVLTVLRDVDRYYGLRFGVTTDRLKNGWSEEECANNFRIAYVDREHINRVTENKRVNFDKDSRFLYVFKLPNGKIVRGCPAVDVYYGLKTGTTANRLNDGWTIEECANNSREKVVRKGNNEFHMPDGTVLTFYYEIDSYYGNRRGTTSSRLNRGWTIAECIKNKQNNSKSYQFNMPDGTILTKASDVDRYYNLKPWYTSNRLRRGWTVEECANNKRNKKEE